MVPEDPDYIAIALEIMERIEKGGLPPWENRWRKSWVDDYRYGGSPIRPDKTPFRGDNKARLLDVAARSGFYFPYWFTVEEMREERAQLSPLARGVTVRWGTADDGTVIHAGEADTRAAAMAKSEDVVFNAQHLVGLPAEYRRRPWEVWPLHRDKPLPQVKAFIDDLGLKVRHRIDIADPTPGMDEKTGYIALPPRELFPDNVSYCRAIAHEAVHWVRRERHGVFEGPGWGRRRRWEEVVADIGAAFLVGDLTGSRGVFDDQVLFVNHWWVQLGEEVTAVMAAAAAAEAAVTWLHHQAPGYRAAPVGTRRAGAQKDPAPARERGHLMHVIEATAEARQFVKEVEGLRGQRYPSHTAKFRDAFRLLDIADRIDLGITDVRNAVVAEATLASPGRRVMPAEAYLDSVRDELQDGMAQAVEEIHRRWNTGPSTGIRM